jgi:outer membrane protein TolC
MLQLDAGVTHLRSPSLTDTDVITSTRDSIVMGSELRKAFSFGTSMSLRLEGDWSRFSSPLFPGSDQEVTLGPAYGINARFTVLQPLLRGFGDDVGEAALRRADVQKSAAERARDRAASELLRNTLIGYWELWYASEARRIETAARDLAKREQGDTEARIAGGALAPVEIYPFRARVSELDEGVLVAELDRRRRAIELGGLIGKPGIQSKQLFAEDAPPAPAAPLSHDDAVARALANSPELREGEARIAAAREGERTAGESDRHRLDLEGWVQTEGLGNQAVPPALEQFGTFGALSAHVGLVWEMPLTGDKRQAERDRARLGTDASIERQEALRQRLETDTTIWLDRIELARERATFAERTEELAAKQLEAAQDKYDGGAGLAIEVQRAEDALRQAQLRQARARVDGIIAELSLEHLTGALLLRHAALLDRVGARRRHVGMRERVGPF